AGLRHRAPADKRQDGGDAELGRLLDDQIELVALSQRLRQGDGERGVALRPIRSLDRDFRAAVAISADRPFVLGALVVEQDDAVAGPEPQHPAHVFQLAAVDGRAVAANILSRNEEARHAQLLFLSSSVTHSLSRLWRRSVKRAAEKRRATSLA